MTIAKDDMARFADEYVLGLLDEEDIRRMEADIEQHAEVRNAVAASRERFLPLDTSVEEVRPNASLWQQIEAGLSAVEQTEPRSDAITPSNDNRLFVWKRTAITSLAASLLLTAGLGWSLMRQVDPVVIAILLNGAGEPQAIVEDFSNEQASIRLLADFAVPEGKTMQVWTLPNRDMGPISLGLLDQRRSAKLATPSLPKPKDEQLYEITLEQTGGSPTGRPTGPILVKGFAKAPR
ncbi:anti-sigma factor [Agrobacterium sp. rho-13.3]|uniref:anti-sigma factor n=1 Tax=Agrobacterium sp. rho-13.3 TaxID=3072980 RepID=UPI002A0EF532|nr:anti-sigma factor [Agrobacterium sp. rho-13.3]MDX8307911.1 anti-sigma factor [Agrobacterium sp. rho-13.3]